MLKSGLYVISVPIGNLLDITLRALETLKKLDKIYCEDTRVTKKLLTLHNIDVPPLIRADDHVEEKIIDQMIEDFRNNLAFGLLSDAGTPLISDPGYKIIKKLRHDDVPIYPIPGVCAAVAAVSVCGLPTDNFIFKGFVPSKQSAREDIIEDIKQSRKTTIFYERPDRIADFIALLNETLPQADCFIARELTKIHEEFIFGKAIDIPHKLSQMTLKGEAVLIIHCQGDNQQNIDDIDHIVRLFIEQGQSSKDICRNSQLLKLASRNELYDIAERIKKQK